MAKTLIQEFTKGLWEEIPPFRLVLGSVPGTGCHHDHGKRHRNGPCHDICSGVFEYSGCVTAKHHSAQSPNRLFHHYHCDLCYRRRTVDAGLCLSLVSQTGSIHPSDCGELYCAGPCRGLCFQEQYCAFNCRRSGYRYRFYPFFSGSRRCTELFGANNLTIWTDTHFRYRRPRSIWCPF